MTGRFLQVPVPRPEAPHARVLQLIEVAGGRLACSIVVPPPSTWRRFDLFDDDEGDYGSAAASSNPASRLRLQPPASTSGVHAFATHVMTHDLPSASTTPRNPLPHWLEGEQLSTEHVTAAADLVTALQIDAVDVQAPPEVVAAMRPSPLSILSRRHDAAVDTIRDDWHWISARIASAAPSEGAWQPEAVGAPLVLFTKRREQPSSSGPHIASIAAAYGDVSDSDDDDDDDESQCVIGALERAVGGPIRAFLQPRDALSPPSELRRDAELPTGAWIRVWVVLLTEKERIPVVPAQARSRRVTLHDCLESFCKPERLSERDTWYCPECKEHVRALKTLTPWTAPPILIVQLKRFAFEARRRERISTVVHFPLEGWQPQFASEQPAPTYDLLAISEHSGGLMGGHYTAHVRSMVDDRWYSCNDSFVGVSSAAGLVDSSAYILVYKRRDADAYLQGQVMPRDVYYKEALKRTDL